MKCRAVSDAIECIPLRWPLSQYCREVLISNALNPTDPKTPSYSLHVASIRLKNPFNLIPTLGEEFKWVRDSGKVQPLFDGESQESLSVQGHK